ncbi:MAG: 50S ribosomal protein L29 [Candidatus Vogelbacteria bacterium CG10_big_fil_rev_8_21_14_0_10_45_14]|uniref:Large ribosomal subunit protein uL29 n=1 Tax=Candidatus Vogelbacteria bacterium CG10_big_fil_rev_8_21_14_0_10_45_14 TaxID=1975042 RepID=A0A2H0RLI4_9BACT|nr:MAG: 50S ribosomal protein L29 [Candidatus Vogelbacteria bacterium CG10_big_fil_rev_8_21_14_0_10_45_14]
MEKTTNKNRLSKESGEKLAKLRHELREFRFQSAGSRAKDVHKGRKIRRNIAKLLTGTNTKSK